MAQKYTTQTGLVAFFDVLGYQNFILHSDIQKSAEVVEEIIVRMPTLARDLMKTKTIANRMTSPINISDSIIWDYPLDPSLERPRGR